MKNYLHYSIFYDWFLIYNFNKIYDVLREINNTMYSEYGYLEFSGGNT